MPGTCFAAGSAFGVSGAGDIFGGPSGRISILACCADVSEVSGAIAADGCGAAGSWADVSDAAGGFAEAADAGAAVTGAAGAGPCEASDAGDVSADGFSGCWRATSTM